MREDAIGLDIGGANIKVASSSGVGLSRRFELWKQPHKLAAELMALTAQFPGTGPVAITMTGELCDCFPTKRDGVRYILAAIASVFSEKRIRVWSTEGRFLSLHDALGSPMAIASANWHAQATFVGRGFRNSGQSMLLIDTGSTTTDVIPIHEGKPVPLGLTDFERLKWKELIYTGVRRTPICALFNVVAEFFATTQDAYLLLGMIAENAEDKATADGRAATKPFAHGRMSRMLGGDSAMTSADETLALARNTFELQRSMIVAALREVVLRLSSPLDSIVVSGSGEFLAQAAAVEFADSVNPPLNIVSLSEKMGPTISEAACAYALAKLATETDL